MRRPDDTTLTPEAERELAAIDATLRGEPVGPERADIAELSLLLQADRPLPDADFARRLDERMARGFARRRVRVRTPGWQLGGGLALAACLLLAIVFVANRGPGQPRGQAAASSAAKPRLPQNSPGAREPETASSGSARAAGPGKPLPTTQPFSAQLPTAPARKVERTSSLTLGVASSRLQDVSHQVFDITTRVFHGYVGSSNVSSDGAAGGATFDLRIPSASVSEAESRLAQLGRVRAQTDTTQDITGAFVSADHRLANAQAERRALLRALARADTRNETEAIRVRLHIAESDIATAQRDLRTLRRRTDLTTLSLTLVPDARGVAAHKGGGGFTPGRALRIAGHVLSVALSVLLIVLAVALPLALVAVAALALAVALRRRRREHALSA